MLQQVQDTLLPVVQTINAYLSDYILVGLLIAVGLWFSIKTRFVQIRCFGEGMGKVFGSLSLSGGRHEGGMSSFQALATAIAAQVGTGNIVGASGAILTGGPGAIFWMWVSAGLGDDDRLRGDQPGDPVPLPGSGGKMGLRSHGLSGERA